MLPPWLEAPPAADPAVTGDAAGDVVDDEADAPPGAFSELPLNPEAPTDAAGVVTTVVCFVLELNEWVLN